MGKKNLKRRQWLRLNPQSPVWLSLVSHYFLSSSFWFFFLFFNLLLFVLLLLILILIRQLTTRSERLLHIIQRHTDSVRDPRNDRDDVDDDDDVEMVFVTNFIAFLLNLGIRFALSSPIASFYRILHLFWIHFMFQISFIF